MALSEGWRNFAGVALLALVLTLGFSRESFGLWPLFTVLDFPGQLGRAAAFLLDQGQGPSLVLGPAPDLRLAAAPFVEVLAGVLGLGLTLGAGALCLFIAPREQLRRAVLRVTSALLILGALWPPYGYLRTPSPLIAGVVLGALSLPAMSTQSERALQFLASAFLLAPLWEMREPLFVSGAPGTDLALLERGSGVPATAWAVLGLAISSGVVMKLLSRPSISTRSLGPPTQPPPQAGEETRDHGPANATPSPTP